MARSGSIEQISRQTDGTHVGVWGRYLLCSAFQPIFSLIGGKFEIVAYEGLIRPFQNEQPVAPGAFFGSIRPIDRFGVETLTRNLHVLNASHVVGKNASLFLNFDPSVFVDRAVSDNALRGLKLALHQSGIDPARVVCELTEQKSGSDEALREFVRVLRDNGFQIAIDDYGADDSDFRRVKEIHPDIVKFDRAWIERLMDSGPGNALLHTMVRSFQDMGIKTLFEGLEETWQLEVAERFNVEMVQGFVLAMPELVSRQRDEDNSSTTDADLSFETASEVDDNAHVLHPPKPSGRPQAKPFGRRHAMS